MRKLLALALLVAATAGGYGWWRRGFGQAGGADPELPTHVVGRGTVARALKETGVVQPRQTVAVKSKVSGRVREVRVAEGQAVRAGELVAVVEPDVQASVALSQRRMELRRLFLDLEQKEREWRRQARLRAEGLVAPQEAEAAEKEYRTADSLFRQAKASLNLLEREANQSLTEQADAGDGLLLTDYRILAPIDGIVATVKVKPGELATSGTTGFSPEGALLLEIADQGELEVKVDINEIDVPRVRLGMTAQVTLAARPGRPIEARVERVAVAARTSEQKLVVYPVALRLLERPEEVRQGMTATVDLVLDAVPDALRIPVLAYAERDGKTWVRRKAGEGLEEREVTLGLRGDQFVEVKAGLDAGDVIAARYPKTAEGS